MAIIDKFTILKNIKGRTSMSNTTKVPGLAKSCFNESKYVDALRTLETVDLELLLDWYTLYSDKSFEEHKRIIRDELEFRSTPLGKELFE